MLCCCCCCCCTTQVLLALHQDSPAHGAAVGQRWARVLAHPHLQRYTESATYYEQTAMLLARAGQGSQALGLIDTCLSTLRAAQPVAVGPTPDCPVRVVATREQLEWLARCGEARRAVLAAAASAQGRAADLGGSEVKAAAYQYLRQAAEECRRPAPVMGAVAAADAQQRSQTFHLQLINE